MLRHRDLPESIFERLLPDVRVQLLNRGFATDRPEQPRPMSGVLRRVGQVQVRGRNDCRIPDSETQSRAANSTTGFI